VAAGKTEDTASDPRYRQLVDTVGGAALFMLNAAGEVVIWGGGAERLTGYAAAERIGQGFAHLFSREGEATGQQGKALSTAGESDHAEHQDWLQRKDGSRLWVQCTVDAMRGAAGEVTGYAVLARDVTGQTDGSATLGTDVERFRLIVESVVDYALFMLDPRGRIASWNPGAQIIKGYAASDIIGREFSVFYTDEDRAAGVPARALQLAAHEGKYQGEGWRVRKDGTRFWASVVIDRIIDRSGKLIGFAKVTRDITELKKAQDALDETRKALLQSQKMEAVGQLTGGVAHDFNNLLTVISNNLDLLSQPSLDEAGRRRLIASAQRAAERGAKLTQQLLAFSRRQPLRPELHSLNRIIGGFEAVLRRAAGDAIDFAIELAPQIGIVRLDAAQFEAALLNLVVNARDAMPGGGALRISTRRLELGTGHIAVLSGVKPGAFVAVTVQDNGEGMSPEVQERAFEPFYTTKAIGRGSGLGLSQVYGFATQSGGHSEIASVSGHGTTVTLYLPIATQAELTETAEAEIATRRAEAGIVLVVEDDPDVLDAAVATLHSLGYEVLTAGDGPSALETLRREPQVDVLFSDVVMPKGMNGVELARQARRIRPAIKVLLASGYPVAALSNDQSMAGEFSFLSKPYRWTELQDKLRSVAQG
jgi:PAS domain S-box-containing protein